ncbi:hypothetical protein Tco_0774496 [Tanacetum coccineum]|uniref:Uncharacterized protein n=1 Tax=Tanacetum coccineum TaxID=301880 RepID=A0ABQ4ZNP4_9ASTR
MAVPKDLLRRVHSMDGCQKIWQHQDTVLVTSSSNPPLTSDNEWLFLSQAKASSSKHKPSHNSGSYSTYTTSSSKATTTATPGLADEVIRSFLATNADDVELIHEDLDQIDDLDLEEMDINWQIAMTAIKIKKAHLEDYQELSKVGSVTFGGSKGSISGKEKHGYRRGTIDKTLFIKKDKKDIILVLIYAFHLHSLLLIFKYIKGKPKLGLWYPRESPLDLVAYSDSDYAAANLDRKSTTGGCQFLGRRLISWQCKKQTIVATSTTEAEYVAAASCCGQVLWLQNQLLDYGFNFMNTIIHIDNQSTICIIKNPVYHSKTKHIEIRHHFIRDCYEKKLIQVQKIHTDLNVADLLTKPFDGPRWSAFVLRVVASVEALSLLN